MSAAGPGLEPPSESLMRFTRIVTSGYFGVFHGVEHRGQENWPSKGPLLVVSNHPTYWDPWLVGMRARRYVYWMAWDAIFEWPLVGRLVKAFRAFPVDLERPKASTFRRARAVLASSSPLGVFPEGGRTSGERGELDPLKPGVARLALASGALLLPVSIRGARRCWPKQRPFPLPGKIVVTYHPPIDPEAVLPGAPPREREQALTALLERVLLSAL